MTQGPPSSERGVVLLNVLAVLAVASSLVLLMAAVQESSIAQSERIGEAAEADAIARGAETSAITALRRAAIETPNVVHYGQNWTHLDETNVAIFGGTFSMRVTDAQSRFNINLLAHPNLLALAQLRLIAVTLGQPAGVADSIAARLLINGPVERVTDLAGFGLDKNTLIALERLTVALPEETRVNLNTADEPLIGILLGNPGSARQLAAKRERQGELTVADLQQANVAMPSNAGFTSDYFASNIDVKFGDTSEHLSSLFRRRHQNGGEAVDVIDRVYSANALIAPSASTALN